MFGVGGLWRSRVHRSGNVVPIAFGGDTCFIGDNCLEATAISEARRWHDRRAATSGWSMAPDSNYLSCSGGLAFSNLQGRGHSS